MSDVKPSRRPYRSDKRAAQAAETRQALLAAARDLFLAQGWARTTISGIASAAGVANETVYAVFGSKPALLGELIRRAVRADRSETPLIEQEVPRRIAEETDQARQIDLFVGDIVGVLERVAPLMDVVRTAAGADETMVRLHADLHLGRRGNLEWFAAALLRNGALRDGMDLEAATDVLWRLASPDLFLLMRRVEGASTGAYAEWLAATLKRLLLVD